MFPSSFVPTTTIITPNGDSGSLAPPTSIHALYHKRTNLNSTSSSKTILFLHGYPQNSDLWYLTIEELEKVYPTVLEEYDIIIPDIPG